MSYLKRSDFLEIIRKSVIDMEILSMLIDKIILSGSLLSLKTKCYSCNNFGHYSVGNFQT